MKMDRGVKRGKLILILALILFISLMFFIRLSYTGMAVKDSKVNAMSVGKNIAVHAGKSENYEVTAVISTVPSVKIDMSLVNETKKEGENIEG